MYTEQKNNKKLKALYEQSLHIKSAIPHPLIMGVIRGTHVPVYIIRTCMSMYTSPHHGSHQRYTCTHDRCTSMYICIHV